MSACSRKTRYPSRVVAERELERIQARGPLDGQVVFLPVRAYRCPGCRGFHLTSNPQKWRK